MHTGKSALLEVDEPHALGSGVIVVETGIVWLTESGQSADLFLRQGQRHSVRGSRRPIIQSLAAGTRVSFHPEARVTRLGDALCALAHALATLVRHRLHLGSGC